MVEIISIFIFVFIGCGVVMVNEISNGKVIFVGVFFVFGFVVMIMIYVVGYILGVYMNFVVMLVFVVVRYFFWI